MGHEIIWDGKRAILTQGTDLNKILMEQVSKRHIAIKNDFYATDILTRHNSAIGVVGLDINKGSVQAIRAKAVIIATGGWQRAYSFTSAPGGLTGGMHAAAYRAGAALLNMEMVTFCPNVILWPPALRGDIFPYILIEMFGDLLDKHGRPFLRDEYDPVIYHIATTTEWNKLIFSIAATKVVGRGDGSPRDGTYYSIKNVPLNILDEAEKIYPGWRWLRTDFTSLIEWLKQGNAVEVAPAAHYMEGGIAVNEHASTTLKGLYAGWRMLRWPLRQQPSSVRYHADIRSRRSSSESRRCILKESCTGDTRRATVETDRVTSNSTAKSERWRSCSQSKEDD